MRSHAAVRGCRWRVRVGQIIGGHHNAAGEDESMMTGTELASHPNDHIFIWFMGHKEFAKIRFCSIPDVILACPDQSNLNVHVHRTYAVLSLADPLVRNGHGFIPRTRIHQRLPCLNSRMGEPNTRPYGLIQPSACTSPYRRVRLPPARSHHRTQEELRRNSCSTVVFWHRPTPSSALIRSRATTFPPIIEGAHAGSTRTLEVQILRLPTNHLASRASPKRSRITTKCSVIWRRSSLAVQLNDDAGSSRTFPF
ncbi:hypothetical protein C8R45DRAFT_314616 [Mycena sanguinolenta]|nr:hypothetical protein C8R45DRAFT_314616 [Mycena sanguinolenta]